MTILEIALVAILELAVALAIFGQFDFEPIPPWVK